MGYCNKAQARTNNDVGEWDSASSKVNANLPDVIKGLDAIDKGEIQKRVSPRCLIIAIIIGIVVAIITGLTDFRRRLIIERAVFFSSVKQGLSMFAGSICIGILIILVFIYQVNYIANITFDLPINIPFLSSYPVASWQIFIFLIYVVSLIIIFATIYGILAKKDKVDCIVPFWLGNYISFLFMLFFAFILKNFMNLILLFFQLFI